MEISLTQASNGFIQSE